MDTTENAGEKVSPKSAFSSSSTLLAVLIVAQILIAVGTYPFLPADIPSHWNAAGQVNGYLPKWIHALLYPGLSLLVVLSIRSRLRYQKAQRANEKVVNWILVGILLFVLVIEITTTVFALGMTRDISFVVTLALSVLFLFLGSLMGKLPRSLGGRHSNSLDAC